MQTWEARPPVAPSRCGLPARSSRPTPVLLPAPSRPAAVTHCDVRAAPPRRPPSTSGHRRSAHGPLREEGHVLMSPEEIMIVANPSMVDNLQVWAALAAVSVLLTAQTCLHPALAFLRALTLHLCFRCADSACSWARMAAGCSRLIASRASTTTKLVLRSMSRSSCVRSRCASACPLAARCGEMKRLRPDQAWLEETALVASANHTKPSSRRLRKMQRW